MQPHELNQPSEIIDAIEEMKQTAKGFIVLAGKNGTGKTFAAKCLYNIAIYPKKSPQKNEDMAIFYTQAELSLSIEKKRAQYNETWSFLEYVRKTKLLILDDVGTRTPSESYTDFLYAIVDYRYNLDLATIVTTNKTAKELREILGDPFVSRIASGKCFRLEGEDRRFKEF